eukprot:scaffold104606_cov55-Phaeocystis_antarctica.AAC.2
MESTPRTQHGRRFEHGSENGSERMHVPPARRVRVIGPNPNRTQTQALTQTHEALTLTLT